MLKVKSGDYVSSGTPTAKRKKSEEEQLNALSSKKQRTRVRSVFRPLFWHALILLIAFRAGNVTEENKRQVHFFAPRGQHLSDSWPVRPPSPLLSCSSCFCYVVNPPLIKALVCSPEGSRTLQGIYARKGRPRSQRSHLTSREYHRDSSTPVLGHTIRLNKLLERSHSSPASRQQPFERRRQSIGYGGTGAHQRVLPEWKVVRDKRLWQRGSCISD